MRIFVALVCILLGLPHNAKAQYKQHQPFRDYFTARAIGGERVYQRIYVGIGKHFLNGKADLHYIGPDSTGAIVDTSVTKGIRSKNSYVLQVGTFFPIVLISDASVLAFNIEFIGSHFDLTIDSVFFHPKALYKRSESITMLGVPVSLEFKTGGDVALSKVRKSMFAIGGGALFGGASSYLATQKQAPVTAIPFIKVEAGYFAGIAFKLRGVAYFGDANFVDRPTGKIFGDDVLTTKTQSGYGYQLSLIVMPFAYGWRTEEWY